MKVRFGGSRKTQLWRVIDLRHQALDLGRDQVRILQGDGVARRGGNKKTRIWGRSFIA